MLKGEGTKTSELKASATARQQCHCLTACWGADLIDAHSKQVSKS